MLVASIQTGALALVGLALLGLFGVLAAVNRRGTASGWGTGRGATMVRLSPEHAVHVVEVEGRRWLVGTGPASAPAVLAELGSSPDLGLADISSTPRPSDASVEAQVPATRLEATG